MVNDLRIHSYILKKITLLHCVSNYPCSTKSLNLKVIPKLKKKFNLPIGFSDHSVGNNAAIMAVGDSEQKTKWGKRWVAMAITEADAGSDSKNISTTAELDGEEWVINGEKIYVTDGDRCDCVVVWATLNKAMGKTAIRSCIS